tara:strand:+ start:884 stop:1012 length:129 start_codon:yes stop_codon:yes gene_type:complete
MPRLIFHCFQGAHDVSKVSGFVELEINFLDRVRLNKSNLTIK